MKKKNFQINGLKLIDYKNFMFESGMKIDLFSIDIKRKVSFHR